MTSAVKIAIIGCGKQATKHLKGLQKIPDVEVVVSDIDVAKSYALAEREGVAVIERPADAIADRSIAAVDICTPTPSHDALIEAAIAAGKHFFCEKPLCETAENARGFARLAEEHGVIGMVGHLYRFSPVFETAYEFLSDTRGSGASPVLGQIHAATMRIGGRGSHALWKHRKSDGGGAINEMLVHMLDLAIWYFGPPSDVRLLVNKVLRPSREIAGQLEAVDAEDFVVAEMVSESGIEVLLQADFLTSCFTQTTEIFGSNGSFFGSIQPEVPSFVFCKHETDGYKAGRTDIVSSSINLHEKQMAEFVRVLQNGVQADRNTLLDSVLVMEVLEALKAPI